MAEVKVVQEREKCISCGACAVLAPDFWELDEEGKSQFRNPAVTNSITLDVGEQELRSIIEAAEACPVNCIHIHKDGKKII